MTKPKKKTDWEKRFDKEFGTSLTGVSNFDHPEAYKWVKNSFSQKLQEEREKIVKEIIKLSDDIEAEKETTVEEWKAFKALRNYLRDNYLKEGEK